MKWLNFAGARHFAGARPQGASGTAGRHGLVQSRMGSVTRSLLAAVVALVVACSSGSNDPPSTAQLPIADGCNPLAADWDCMLPFPSDVFLVDDPAMPNKKRLKLGNATMKTKEGTPVDFTTLHPADGASHLPQILAVFPGGVDRASLVFHDKMEQTLDVAKSSTLILEADTGKPVLHFAELDPRATEDPRRALVLRPGIRLQNGKRYVVAIRNLNDKAGKKVVAPEGFRLLRDNAYANHTVLGPLGKRYETDVFGVLSKAGVTRSELQLAWDFTVRSEDNATRDMLEVRKLILESLEKSPPKITIDKVEEAPDARTFRLVHGTMTLPLFLEAPGPLSKLKRDATGKVIANGTVDVKFDVFVPPSAGTGEPARAFTYGHGFFGEKEELSASWSQVPIIAEKAKMIGAAVDWVGMAAADEDPVADLIVQNKMSEVFVFTDRVHQAMANQIALGWAMKGPLSKEPSLAGRYDPTSLYWFGISQGHILGSTYVALSPYVDRAVLQVGGAGFSMMMPRSESFTPFIAFIQILVPDALDLQKFIAMSQLSMDRIEAGTYSTHLIANGYPGGPSTRKVLMQTGLYDSLVPNIASDVQARTLGVKHLAPSSRKVAGLDDVNGPYDGSAQIDFDFKVPANKHHGVEATIPTEDNKVHGNLRKLEVCWKQIDAFLKPDGKVQSFCDGACDPE